MVTYHDIVIFVTPRGALSRANQRSRYYRPTRVSPLLYWLHPIPSSIHDVCFPFRASLRFRSFARMGCTISWIYNGNKHYIAHSCPPYYRFISSKHSDSRFPPGPPPPPPPTYLLLYLRQTYHPPSPSLGPSTDKPLGALLYGRSYIFRYPNY